MKPDPDAEPPGPAATVAAGLVAYALLLGAALGWLWWRDRLAALPELAIGPRGPVAAAAAGLLVGWLGAGSLAVASRWSPRLREFEAMAVAMLRPAGERGLLVLVLCAAVAEEAFFRLAVLDALGLAGSVAISALVHTSTKGLGPVAWAAAQACVLGLLVQHGFGLLAATTAHAITHYLRLRTLIQP